MLTRKQRERRDFFPYLIYYYAKYDSIKEYKKKLKKHKKEFEKHKKKLEIKEMASAELQEKLKKK